MTASHRSIRSGAVPLARRIDDRVLAWMATTDHGPLHPAVHQVARTSDLLGLHLLTTAWLVAPGGDRPRGAAVRGWAAAGLAALLVDGVVKPAVERGRPDPRRFPRHQRRSTSPSTSAFPSGHVGAVTAFAVAVGREVPRLRPWLAVSTFAVGYSRLYTGRHYLSDAIAGAAIGVAAGFACGRPPQERRTDAATTVDDGGRPDRPQP